MSNLHLFAVTSGWDGPFQLSEVLVAAGSHADAISHAESAFADANQPICRAKMQIADLGAVTDGPMAAPRASGAALTAEWRPVERRCDPAETGA